MFKTLNNWHKKQIDWWKNNTGVSEYGLLWISFVKGLLIGLLVYHLCV